MDQAKIQNIQTAIKQSTLLSEDEKRLLVDVVPYWPEAEINNLLKNIGQASPSARIPQSSPLKPHLNKPTPPAPPLRPSAAPRPTSELGSLQTLKERLEKDRVNFDRKNRKSEIKPPAPKPVQLKPPTVEDVLKPPAPKATHQPLNETKPANPSPHRSAAAAPLVRKKEKVSFGRPLGQITSTFDLTKIALADLRRDNFDKNLQTLYEKVGETVGSESTLLYFGLKELEKSPVNQLFLKTGLYLMNDISKDRNAAFEQVRRQIESIEGEAFTKEEFYKFSDLMSHLEDLA